MTESMTMSTLTTTQADTSTSEPTNQTVDTSIVEPTISNNLSCMLITLYFIVALF